MRVRVSDAHFLCDLLRFLRDCGCIAEQASANEADVFVPDARSEWSARMEVATYLSGWGTRHPEASAAIVEG
jgi:hypothetical protein